jgi:hypothetical protein
MKCLRLQHELCRLVIPYMQKQEELRVEVVAPALDEMTWKDWDDVQRGDLFLLFRRSSKIILNGAIESYRNNSFL